MAFDILIKSGSLLNGAGSPPTLSDVGIKGDKISDIGLLENASADVTINASGKYVTPGFIDLTNHSDTHLTLFKYPGLESLLMQGVTTIIGGNCGTSLAPLGSKEALNSIRKWADPSQINIDWATVEEFLQKTDVMRPALNFGTFIGYGTLRRGVIGDEARLLNLEEREKVKLMLRDGIRQGAFGLSLGLSYGHERASTTEEIIEIAKVVGEEGGIIKLHLRSEGKEILSSVNEAVRIGRETGALVQISHLKAIGKKAWPSLPKAMELINESRSSGLKISFDVSPYSTTGSPLYLLIPAWARQDGFDDLFQKISDPEERKKIIEALKLHTLHYEKILIISAKTKTIVGKTIEELAQSSGLSPEETLLDTVLANEGRVTIVGRTVSRKNVELLIEDGNSLVSSDGAGYSEEAIQEGNLAHPRSFGAFAHFWHHFVNDKKAIAPQEAIKKITSAPAKILGIEKRGVLSKGNFADIAIFDPQNLRDRATYKNPFRYSGGMEWVLVNGKIAVKEGKPQGIRAGNILKRHD